MDNSAWFQISKCSSCLGIARRTMGGPSCASFLVMVLISSLCIGVAGLTDSQDIAVLTVLKLEWKNTVPPNWRGADPCYSKWYGVNCNGSQVTSLALSSMNLTGTLPEDIGSLIGLRMLDLSYNKDLIGPIPSSLGNLVNLETLIAIGCGFTGQIPNELGNLRNLSFLALNSNQLTGSIPSSLGNLDKLYWLDLCDNQLTGSLPVSHGKEPGLDKLSNAKHFHLSQNRLAGRIPPDIFHSRMKLIHVLFDSNDLDGEIPSTLGLVETLEVLRLDRNSLHGQVPSNISNLKYLSELHLSNNKLEGSVPDLSGLTNLQYVDLSNNSFDSSEVPPWFTTLQLLTTLIMENGRLTGQLSSEVFDLPHLETVMLRNNFINGTLKIDPSVSQELKLIDLENNRITNWAIQSYGINLMLFGNPACDAGVILSNKSLCQRHIIQDSYSDKLTNCSGKICSGEFKPNPQTCQCQVPYKGELIFEAPSFSDLWNTSRFKQLEDSLQTDIIYMGAVLLCCFNFDSKNYLHARVQFFPADNCKYFGRMEITRIGSALSQQIYRAPQGFGPYIFIGYSYPLFDVSDSDNLKLSANIGIAVGAAVLAIGIVCIGVYALKQKWKAERAIELLKPFAPWGSRNQSSGGAPKLKGARLFSFAELKKCTNNFSKLNEIGSGGYGKVYKGVLLGGGQMVAIKRAQRGCLQGEAEFMNEIELLSRVHHKNLVGLIGFCFEKGERMLVYEYISNGTLRENLCGRAGVHLDWRQRIHIALGSSRGLNYLHEHASPPIIHRDVKSTNILLDKNLNAKVADFGLSKLVADRGIDAGGEGHVTTQVKGTVGYVDPEYYMTNQLTHKSDVYSFGVVLLELITALPPIDQGKYIVRQVRMTWDMGGIKALCEQLMDPFLKDSSAVLPGLERFVNLALCCVEETTAPRPTMSEVVKELESIAEEGLNNSISSHIEHTLKTKVSHNTLIDEANPKNLFDYRRTYMVP